MTFHSELLNQLANFGVSVRAEGEKLRILPPATWTSWDDAPEECRPLLRDLKARRDEVIAFLKWDEEKALQECELMFGQLNKRYPKGALEFAYASRPDLVKALQAAEESYTQAWHRRDMAGCRKALPAVEAAIVTIIEAYELEEQGIWPTGRD